MSSTKALAVRKTALSKIPEGDQARIATELLEEYLDGEAVTDSAAKRGISPSTAYTLLARHTEQGFKDAQIARALESLEAAEADMADTTGDGLKLARAEKRAKAAQWKLERLFKQLYGSDEGLTIAPVVIQIANLRG